MNQAVTATAEGRYSEVEILKRDSRGLCLPIPADLSEDRPDFSQGAAQILKHHGVYQQTDRDRKTALTPQYRLMVRIKLPGGLMTAEQYLLCDRLASEYGQGRLRITSRQGLQFHGVRKRDLRPLIHDLAQLGALSTLAAAGDVVRNVMAPPVADIDPVYHGVQAGLLDLARQLSNRFIPETPAYAYLWSDDRKVELFPDGRVVYLSEPPSPDEDSFYGTKYLPRKFKIALAADFDNSVDVFSNDAGLIAVTDGDGPAQGYELVAGGGLGFRLSQPETFASAASPLAFVQAHEAVEVLEAVVSLFRDHGNRSNRNRARLKYLLRDWGAPRFRQALEERLGRRLAPPRNILPSAQPDYLGWSPQLQPGYCYLGVWIEHGRIRDCEEGPQYKRGLRAVIEQFKPEVRFTPQGHLILAYIRETDREAVRALLATHGISDAPPPAPLHRHSMVCPSLPLCPMACAEAERALPELLDRLARAGHGNLDVTIRMSGCPNGCSRPRMAEAGVLGHKKGRYALYVGGSRTGSRVNDLLTDGLTLERLSDRLAVLFEMWKGDRDREESFGDWCWRQGVAELAARLCASDEISGLGLSRS